jgi:hypothetical protein
LDPGIPVVEPIEDFCRISVARVRYGYRPVWNEMIAQ